MNFFYSFMPMYNPIPQIPNYKNDNDYYNDNKDDNEDDSDNDSDNDSDSDNDNEDDNNDSDITDSDIDEDKDKDTDEYKNVNHLFNINEKRILKLKIIHHILIIKNYYQIY